MSRHNRVGDAAPSSDVGYLPYGKPTSERKDQQMATAKPTPSKPAPAAQQTPPAPQMQAKPKPTVYTDFASI